MGVGRERRNGTIGRRTQVGVPSRLYYTTYLLSTVLSNDPLSIVWPRNFSSTYIPGKQGTFHSPSVDCSKVVVKNVCVQEAGKGLIKRVCVFAITELIIPRRFSTAVTTR